MTMKMRSFLIGFATFTIAASLPNKRENSEQVLYDQRQEGDWNVRADLDNFMILIIPTQTVSNSPSSSQNFLDFLTKSLPRRSHFKKTKHVKKHKPDSKEDPMKHFIESKTAPYHVDITKTKSHLDSTNVIQGVKPQTDTPVLNKRFERSARIPRVYLVTVPSEEEKVQVVQNNISNLNNANSDIFPIDDMKLLGAEYEQCGPGLVRDVNGVCTIS